MSRRWLLGLACAGALGGPTLQQATLLGLSPTDGPVMGALAVVGALALLVAAVSTGPRAAAAVQAIVLVLFADATLGLRGLAEQSVPDGWTPAGWAPAILPAVVQGPLVAGLVLASLLLDRVVRGHGPALLAAFFLASAAAAAVVPSGGAVVRSSGTSSSDRPVLLHLVLDSLQAPLDVTADLSPAPALAEAAQTLVDDGFHVDSLVYSPSYQTPLSLGSLFRGYFDRLAAAGYRIEVVHCAYPDLCGHAAVERCDTASLRPNRRAIYDMLEQTDPGIAVVATARVLSRPKSLINDIALLILAHRAPSLRYVVQPREAHDILERVMARAAVAPLGTAIIAHVLLPHPPYALDADCQPVERPLSDWVGQETPLADPATRQHHLSAYAAQAQCALRTVRAALPALDGVAIIIHGDHGSRILSHDPEPGDPTDPNLNGTMLAVRAPGVVPGLSRAPARLDERLRATWDRLLAQGS